MNVHLIEHFDSDPTFIENMRQVAKIHADAPGKLLLIACGDTYAQLVSKHKDELSQWFICPYVDYELLKRLNSKGELLSSLRRVSFAISGKPKLSPSQCMKATQPSRHRLNFQ